MEAVQAVPVVKLDPTTLAITEAFKAEVEDATLTKDQTQALQMKYGIIAPILTPSELYLIQKEERKRERSNTI